MAGRKIDFGDLDGLNRQLEELNGQVRDLERRLTRAGIRGNQIGTRQTWGRSAFFEDPVDIALDPQKFRKKIRRDGEKIRVDQLEQFLAWLEALKGGPLWMGGEGTGNTGPQPPDGGPVGSPTWSFVDKMNKEPEDGHHYELFEWPWDDRPKDGLLQISIEVMTKLTVLGWSDGYVQLWLSANQMACGCTGQDGGLYERGSPPVVHTIDLGAFDWRNDGTDRLYGRVMVNGDVTNFEFGAGLPDEN